MRISLGTVKGKILKESRLSDLIDLYPESARDTILHLASGDPSGNNKYLKWMVNQVIDMGENSHEVIAAIGAFHANIQRIVHRDIFSYLELKDLQQVLEAIPSVSKRQQKKQRKADIDVVFDNGVVRVIYPRTHSAAQVYGRGTKWCTTMDDPQEYYENNSDGNTTFYAFLGDKKFGIFVAGATMPNVLSKIEIYDENDGQLHTRRMVMQLGGLPLLRAIFSFISSPRRVSYDHVFDSSSE